MAIHDANNMPSYEHFKGTPKPSHMGSQSHMGSSGGPSGHPSFGGGNVGGHDGAARNIPPSKTNVGSGSATKNPISDD